MPNRTQLPYLVGLNVVPALNQRLLVSFLRSHLLLQVVTGAERLLLGQLSKILNMIIDFAHDCLILLIVLRQVQAIYLSGLVCKRLLQTHLIWILLRQRVGVMLRLAQRKQSVATIVLRIGLVVYDKWLVLPMQINLLSMRWIHMQAIVAILS